MGNLKRLIRSYRAVLTVTTLLMLLLPCSASVQAAISNQAALDKLDRLPGIELPGDRSEIKISYQSGVYEFELPDSGVTVMLFELPAGGGGSWHAMLRMQDPTSFGFNHLSPALADRILGDVRPSDLVLIASGADVTVKPADLPARIRRDLADYNNSDGELALMKGANLFVGMKVGKRGLLGQLGRALAINNQVIRLTGQVEAYLMNGTQMASDPEGRLAVTLQLPSLRPVPFNRIGNNRTVNVEYPYTHLSVSRTISGKDETLEISGVQEIRLWLLDKLITMQGTLAIETKNRDEYEITTSAKYDLAWVDPFGARGVVIDSIGFIGSFAEAEDDSDLGVALTTTLSFPDHGQLKGNVQLKRSGNEITEVGLKIEGASKDDAIQLSAIPGFRQLPLAANVSLRKIKGGINPKTKDAHMSGIAHFSERNITADASLMLKDASSSRPNIILALKTDGLNLHALAPSLPPITENFSLDHGVMTVSTADLRQLRAGDLPDSMTSMFAGSSLPMPGSIPSGTGLTFPIDPAKLGDQIKKMLGELDIDQPMVISGSVGGIFDNEPSMSLYAHLPSVPTPRLGGQRLTVRDIGGALFMSVGKQGSGVEFQLGIDGAITTRIGNDDLEFGGKVFIAASAISQGIQVSGRMLGAWNDPFGLVGITYRDVMIGGGVNADSSVDITFEGQADFGDRLKYTMGGDTSLIMGGGVPVPKLLGVMFTGSELSMTTQFKIQAALFKAAAAGPLSHAIPDGPTKALLNRVVQTDLITKIEETFPLPYAIYKDVGFYIATPGASVPGFDDIEGLGGAVRGTLYFMGHNFGSVDSYVTLNNGLKLSTKPGDFDLGPGFSLKNAELDIRIPIPGVGASDEKAYALVTGAAGAGCQFVKGDIDVHFDRDKAHFSTTGQFGQFEGEINAHVNLSQFPRFDVRGLMSDSFSAAFPGALRESASTMIATRKAEREKKVAALSRGVENAQDAAAAELDRQLDAAAREVDKKLNAIASLMGRKKANSDQPVKGAWALAEDKASGMKVKPDGSISGVKPFDSSLDALAKLANKATRKIGSAINDSIKQARQDLKTARTLAGNLVGTAKNHPRVTQATARVTSAQAELELAKQEAFDELVDPLATFVSDAADDALIVDKAEFDSGLDALCRGKSPQFVISGTYKSQPFEIELALDLSGRDIFRSNQQPLAAALAAVLAGHQTTSGTR